MHCHQVQGWRYLRHLPSHLPYSSLPLGLRYTEHWHGNSTTLLSSLIPYATYHNDSHDIPHRNLRHFLTLLQLTLIVLLSFFGHHPPSYYQFIQNDAHHSFGFVILSPCTPSLLSHYSWFTTPFPYLLFITTLSWFFTHPNPPPLGLRTLIPLLGLCTLNFVIGFTHP
jgi:hypothetical protein